MHMAEVPGANTNTDGSDQNLSETYTNPMFDGMSRNAEIINKRFIRQKKRIEDNFNRLRDEIDEIKRLIGEGNEAGVAENKTIQQQLQQLDLDMRNCEMQIEENSRHAIENNSEHDAINKSIDQIRTQNEQTLTITNTKVENLQEDLDVLFTEIKEELDKNRQAHDHLSESVTVLQKNHKIMMANLNDFTTALQDSDGEEEAVEVPNDY
ncbi:hypothetical protein CYMTET_9712 [Cymbomonas tetramitiformis]|uniref:Uncharacterized protein n=1 Tax=Cymbomonas tetramitiformis TaxID=36881 RepID=A0AAE0LEK5_9CHLO|nr:hypothetical protein CYMTET_9712 [Cymbomonas tetramitiformis]